MKKIIFFAMALCVFALLTNCKKDSASTPTTTTNTNNNQTSSPEELLAGTTSKSWKYVKIISDGTDVTGMMSCLSDNTVTFSRNGNYSDNNGTNTCNEVDPQVVTAKWSFSADKKSIVFQGGENNTATILELTKDKLRMNTTWNGDPMEATYALK